jgi:hypothetical protein
VFERIGLRIDTPTGVAVTCCIHALHFLQFGEHLPVECCLDGFIARFFAPPGNCTGGFPCFSRDLSFCHSIVVNLLLTRGTLLGSLHSLSRVFRSSLLSRDVFGHVHSLLVRLQIVFRHRSLLFHF